MQWRFAHGEMVGGFPISAHRGRCRLLHLAGAAGYYCRYFVRAGPRQEQATPVILPTIRYLAFNPYSQTSSLDCQFYAAHLMHLFVSLWLVT